MRESKRQWSEIIFLGAQNSCPREDCLPGCPLSSFLKMSLSERAATMVEMSDDELYDLAAYHDTCSAFGIPGANDLNSRDSEIARPE